MSTGAYRGRSPVAEGPSAVLAGVYLVIVFTATALPFLSPFRLSPVVTPAYQGARLVAWIIWLVAILVVLVRQPDNPLWKLMFVHMVAAQIWVVSYVGESMTWSLSLTFEDLWIATGSMSCWRFHRADFGIDGTVRSSRSSTSSSSARVCSRC